MDWGAIALVVTANAVTTALIMTAGLWYLQRRSLAVRAPEEPAMTEVEASPERVEPEHIVEPEHRRRRRVAVREPEPEEVEHRSGPRRRGLRDVLAAVGGLAGSITEDQRVEIRRLLGKAAPASWMSSEQAHAVLCARDYAEAVIDHRQGTRMDFEGRGKIVRRLVLAIVADDRARDFVIDWAEGRYADDEGAAPDPLEQDVWAWVQHHAARLLEAEGRYVEAA